MPRPSLPEPVIRKAVGLTAAMWAEVDAQRRAEPHRIPSQNEMVRRLLREALDARNTPDATREGGRR